MPLEMKYFILKPKSKYPDDPYACASRIAMIRYAEKIYSVDPELANQLDSWVSKEFANEIRLREKSNITPTAPDQCPPPAKSDSGSTERGTGG